MAEKRAQRKLGVILLFLIHGLIDATWVSRIPQIQERLHAATGPFGIALLGSAAGAMISMPFTGWLLARFEGKRVLVASSMLFCAVLPPLGLPRSLPALMGVLVLYGMAGGAMDIAMNAFGAAVDKESPRPAMSMFHGMFSAGGIAGAGAGVLAIRSGLAIETHLLLAAAALIIGVIAAAPLFPQTPPEPGLASESRFQMPPAPLLGLGVLAFCILFGERAMADWTGIYLVQRGGSDSYAALGFASFSAAMTAGRFAGDWLIHRFGDTRVLRAGSAIAAIGLLAAIVAGTPQAGLAGFSAVGAGFSVVVPILYRGAASIPGIGAGVAIATVTTMGYLGFFVGPPAIGFLAQAVTLRWALLSIVALSGAVAIFTARSPRSAEPMRLR